MKKEWHKTQFTGIEFYRHETRKHGVKFDAYYRGRFTYRGKAYISGFGWASEGWTPAKAFAKLQEYRNNAKSGRRAVTFKEEQALREAAAAQKAAEEQLKAKADTTFAKFFEDVYTPIEKDNVKWSTFRTQIGHFKLWINPAIGRLRFSEISIFHIEKIKHTMLKAGKSPRTLQNCMATLRRAWRIAIMKGYTNRKWPTKNIKLPKFDNKRIRFLSHKEAEQLLEALKKHSQQVHDIALLSLHTGLRAGEIFHLNWGDVDFKAGTIFVRDPKSSENRFAYLTEAARDMLKSRYAGQALSEPVFRDAKGHRVKEVSNVFGKIVKELGFNEGITDRRQRLCFHSLRHSFASWLLRSADLYTVKTLLGHSTIQLTERYSHLAQSGLQKAVKDFDRQLRTSKDANIIDMQARKNT